jgi:hypothetical protein
MRIPSIRSFVLLPALLLSACVTQVPPHEFLPNAARDKIASTEGVVPMRQSEIYVFVPSSQIAAAGGGGLLLALIDAGVDSVRTTKAEAAVKPLRDSLVDYSFDQSLQNDLKSSLARDGWMHAGEMRTVREVTGANLDGVLAASKADAVLFATTDYRLSNDGNELTVTMTASLFANSDALRAVKPAKNSKMKTALENSLYHNTLTFQTDVPTPSADRDLAIAAWSANRGEAMRKALDMGASKLAAMLAADIQRPENDPGADETSDMTVDKMAGRVVGNDPDGVVLRHKDGTLAYFTKSKLQ